MRILHILDHALPLHSGYAFRTRAILRQQQALGWDTFHLTGSRQGPRPTLDEVIDGLHFQRTPQIAERCHPGMRWHLDLPTVHGLLNYVTLQGDA